MLRGGVGSLFLPYFYFHHPDCVLSGEDGDTSGKEQAYTCSGNLCQPYD